MKKHNVILIMTDQQRYDCLGCNGNPYVKTPNIDALAREGTVFTRHIAANPVCQPSRVSLFTGLYPPGHGVYTNGIALNRREYVNSHAISIAQPVTLADAFAEAGYDTASFGKLHLTPNIEGDSREHKCPVYPESYGEMAKEGFRAWNGPYYGFRHVEMTGGHGEIPVTAGHYAFWLKDQAPELYAGLQAYANPYVKGVKNADREKLPVPGQHDLYQSKIPSSLHNTTWMADRFIDFLDNGRQKDKPFFTFIGFPDPHHPFTPSFDIMEQFEGIEIKKPYDPDGKGIIGSPLLSALNRTPSTWDEELIRYTYAMIYQVDMAVGRIIEAVKKAGLWEDTIFVFTSDHGDFLGDHGLFYKGEVGAEALLHIPYVMRVPGMELPARTNIPMSNTDVMPTLLACAGAEGKPDLHGADITKLLDMESRQVFAYCNNNTKIENINYTVYDRQYRYTWYPFADKDELFDHDSDPGECINISGTKAYIQLIADFRRNIADNLIRHNNPIVGRVATF